MEQSYAATRTDTILLYQYKGGLFETGFSIYKAKVYSSTDIQSDSWCYYIQNTYPSNNPLPYIITEDFANYLIKYPVYAKDFLQKCSSSTNKY